MSETWIILGATSGMARAFARKLAEKGHALVLCGRRLDDMASDAKDLEARGASNALVSALDIRDPASFAPIIEEARGRSGLINVAVFVGTMPEQSEIDADPSLVDGTIMDSFTGPARFLSTIAPVLEERGGGAIVGISSVAGDRGRVTNYVYGSAKAGFSCYLSGLRNRLGRSGVHVMTVKPGPVDTPMTWGKGKQPFMTKPEAVADDILKGMDRGRNTIYTAKIWAVIMLIIRLIPEPIFKKMSF